MSRTFVLILIPLLVISGLYATPIISRANADLTGEVCLAPVGSTSCPVAPPMINSTGPPSPQVRVAVVVNGSGGLNGFDITLFADSTFLKPAGASTTGTVLQGTPQVLVNCIGGIGLSCAFTDTPDTLHFAISIQSLTFSPTTGLLFTAIYNVTANTYNTPIRFQTGCGGTSVGGGVCITLTNGSHAPLPETFQTAKYSNKPYFDLQPLTIGSLTVEQGGTDGSLSLNVTSINDFSGTVTITASVLPTGPGVSIAQTSLTVNQANPQNFTQVTVSVSSSVSPGLYVLNFTATIGSLPPNTLLFPLTVPQPDFVMSSNPENVKFNVTTIGNATITLSSRGNFSGTVNLALQTSSEVTASFSSASVFLPLSTGGATTTSASTSLRVNSTIAGSYGINITATSGQLTHTITVLVTVLDFVMTVPPVPLFIAQGTTGLEPVFFGPSGTTVYNTTATVKTIFINQETSTRTTGPSTGVSVTCTPSSVTIFGVGSSESPVPTNCAVTGTVIGNYTVTVVASSGAGSRIVTHAVTFSVVVTGPDFTMTQSTVLQVVSVGQPSTVSVLVFRTQGLNSSVSIAADFPPATNPPSPPTVTISPASFTLNSTYPNATAIVSIITSGSSPTGTYFLIVTATAAASQTTHLLVFAIVVTTTTSPHALEVYSVKPSTTSTTVGENVSVSITVRNIGKLPENSTVLALVGDLTVGNQTFTNLQPGEKTTVTITWNTSGFSAGSYTIGGQVMGVSGQTDFSQSVARYATPVTLTAANTGIFSSGYVEPAAIIAIIVVLAIVIALMLQSRRKTPKQ